MEELYQNVLAHGPEYISAALAVVGAASAVAAVVSGKKEQPWADALVRLINLLAFNVNKAKNKDS